MKELGEIICLMKVLGCYLSENVVFVDLIWWKGVGWCELFGIGLLLVVVICLM